MICRAMCSASFGLAAEERYVKRVRIFQTCRMHVNSCEIRTGPPAGSLCAALPDCCASDLPRRCLVV